LNFWLKIGIEIVLVLLLTFCGYGFWMFSRLPRIFDVLLSSEDTVAFAIKTAGKSGKREAAKVAEELMALDDMGMFTEQAKYTMCLTACYFNPIRVWKIEKRVFLFSVLVILAGSYFLYWPVAVVNLLIFVMLGFVSDSPLAVKDAASQAAMMAEVVRIWLKKNPKRCRKFCLDTPMFTAVYRHVSSKDANSGNNLIVLGSEQWQKTSAK
jgi:hypothetical protein